MIEILDPLTVSSTAATALGAYNIARWFADQAIEKRRQAKNLRQLVAGVARTVRTVETVRSKVEAAGGSDREKLRVALEALQSLVEKGQATNESLAA